MKVFGDFEFDENLMQLRRGGLAVPINGQCLDLLALLLDRPGQLVTREEIKRSLWPDSNVDFEHSLDVLVNRLRQALGDNRKSARYILTVPKKGYRFVEPVSFSPDNQDHSTTINWTRSFARYASVAVLAALMAILFAHTRYQKFVPAQGVVPAASSR